MARSGTSHVIISLIEREP